MAKLAALPPSQSAPSLGAPGLGARKPTPLSGVPRWARPVGQVLLSPPHLTGGEMAALEADLTP